MNQDYISELLLLKAKVSLPLALLMVAAEGIREANKGNPFISKSQAFSFYNEVRK